MTVATMGQIETYYTPERVRYWLEHWADLLELAQNSIPAIRYDDLAIKHAGGMRPSDRFRWCHIVADIERAWIQFPRWSLRFQVVEWTIIRSEPIRTMEDCLRIRHGEGMRVYLAATEEMARYLGWLP